MRRRYWLPALICGGIGAVVVLLSIAYRFSGFVLCAIAVTICAFGLLDALQARFPRVAKWARRIMICGLSLVFALGIATGIWIGIHMDGAEVPEAEFAVVLGAGVNGTRPSQSLRERLEASEAYLNAYPEAILILSGGQGNNEDISEAQCMYNWLLDRGIAPERLRMEERSTNTQENIAFSLDLIEAEFGIRPTRIAVISSEYHLLRATLIADDVRVDALGYPAHTRNPFFFSNMFVREIVGVWSELIFG